MAPHPPSSPTHFPGFYRFVFLWLEPVSILAGAVLAFFMQATYLHWTHAASAPGAPVPISTSIVLDQLANLYLGLAALEASLLRASSDTLVWKVVIIILLCADVGHLYSVRALGTTIYWQYWRWNPIDWGNVPFVYFLAATRISMLLGVGIKGKREKLKY